MMFRHAKLQNLESLVELENKCFNYDQLHRHQFRYFMGTGTNDLIVLIDNGDLAGYGLVLYRKNSKISRLYSLAIDPVFQGKGYGLKLLKHLELQAKKRSSFFMSLEVKTTNHQAIKLYEGLGYQKYQVKHHYYQDGGDALCFRKNLINKNH